MNPNSTISSLTSLYKNGSVTPLDYVEYQLKLIDKHNATKINAIAQYMPKQYILQKAKESTTRYKQNKPLSNLDGISFTIKDTNGTKCELLNCYEASMVLFSDTNYRKKDKTNKSTYIVDLLLSKGAILLCSSTTPEITHRGETSSPLYGPTINAHNPLISPGGSSGGAGVLTSLGIGNINLGTDSGGSVRIPAFCNGVIGFKPSYNLSYAGNEKDIFNINHCGACSRNVADVAVYLKHFADLRNVKMDLSESYIKQGVKGLNICVSKTLNGVVKNLDENIVWQCILKTVEKLKGLGANIYFDEPVALSSVTDPNVMCGKMHQILWYDTFYKKYVDEENIHLVDKELMEHFKIAEQMKADELVKLIRDKKMFGEIMDAFLVDNKYDLLITPTCPILPPENRIHETMNHYTALFNFTNQPAISVNCGIYKLENGIAPIGMQIVSNVDKDNLVLRAAYTVEKQCKFITAKL